MPDAAPIGKAMAGRRLFSREGAKIEPRTESNERGRVSNEKFDLSLKEYSKSTPHKMTTRGGK